MSRAAPVNRPGRVRRVAASGLVGLVLAGTALGGAACTDDGDTGEFCDRLSDIPDVSSILSEIDGSDPSAARTTLQEGVRDYRALEAAAPGDIRADIARVRQGVELVLEAVESNPDDLPAARQEIQAQADELAGLLQAGEAVVDYASNECDVSLVTDPSDGSGNPGSTPTSAGG